MPLYVVKNDITKMQVDAVVNAANYYPIVGYGVDEDIYNAAGFGLLLRDRKRIGIIKEGHSVSTLGYGLPAYYIIHTVGTYWQGGNKGEELILRNCYRTALAEAVRLESTSVAIPFLATGNFGFPKDLALDIALEEIRSFINKQDITVYLVVYDENSLLAS